MLSYCVYLLVILFAQSLSYQNNRITVLPYQAHSFNDLNLFSSLFLRGTTYFKVDVSMVDRQSCKKYSTWSQKDNNCSFYKGQFSQQICCLGMRGDASSYPHLSDYFNTSTEFAYNLRHLLIDNPSRHMQVAINFQFRHYFDEGLIENFLLQLVDLLNQFGDRLQIGTGSDSFILQYDRVCKNKKIQYEANQPAMCTKQRLSISSSKIFLQSSSMNPNDSRDIYSRYRHFNVMFRQAQKFCKNGFPTWINKYKQFPLTFWQPSNERQIRWLFDTVLSPQCMKKHNRTQDQITIASNLDPQMVLLYKKSKTYQYKFHLTQNNQNWNAIREKVFLRDIQRLKLAKLDDDKGIYVVKNIQLSQISVDILQQIQPSIFEKQNQKQLQISGKIIDAEGSSQFNKLYVVYQNQETKQASISIYSGDLVFQKKIQTGYLAGKINQQFQPQLIYIRKATNNYQLVQLLLKNDAMISLMNITLNFNPTDLTISIQNSTNFIVIVGEKDNQIMKAVINMNTSSVINQAFITYGSNPMITVSDSGKDYGMINLIIQNGICQSALLLNNNQLNKCRIPANPTFQNLTRIPSVVNLIRTNVENFLSEQNKKNEPINACTMKYQTIKLFQGKNSQIIQYNDNFYIGSQFVSIRDQGLMNAMFCGGSNYEQPTKGFYLAQIAAIPAIKVHQKIEQQ